MKQPYHEFHFLALFQLDPHGGDGDDEADEDEEDEPDEEEEVDVRGEGLDEEEEEEEEQEIPDFVAASSAEIMQQQQQLQGQRPRLETIVARTAAVAKQNARNGKCKKRRIFLGDKFIILFQLRVIVNCQFRYSLIAANRRPKPGSGASSVVVHLPTRASEGVSAII